MKYLSTKAVASYVSIFEREVVDMCEQLYVRGQAGAVAVNPQVFAL